MSFSRLFIFLVFAGIIPIAVGWIFNAAFLVFVVYNAALLVLWAVDAVITPGKSCLEVSRICEERFSLGASNEVVIKVRNNSRYDLLIEFRDEIPQHFTAEKTTVKAYACKYSFGEAKYHVVPRKRGQFIFGCIHARYDGVLKLCKKFCRFETSMKCKVYPNLKDLNRCSLDAVSRLWLHDPSRRIKAYAMGTEFESLKEYTEGDDYRKINWMATARANKLIVNNYEPEKNQQVLILMDCSRVMNPEINGIKKLDYAVNSAFVLADSIIRSGDNAGLVVFDDKVRRFIKPGKGQEQFRLICESLYDVRENFVTADYEGVLSFINLHQKRRSLLCFFTEMFNCDEAARFAAALVKSASRHVPLIISIRDERVYKAAFMNIRSSDELFLKCAAIRLVNERENALKVLRSYGIACIDTAPDKLSMEVIKQYLKMKAG